MATEQDAKIETQTVGDPVVETPAAKEAVSEEIPKSVMDALNEIIGSAGDTPPQTPEPSVEPSKSDEKSDDGDPVRSTIVDRLADRFMALFESDKPKEEAAKPAVETPAVAKVEEKREAAVDKVVEKIIDDLDLPDLTDEYDPKLRQIPKAVRAVKEQASKQIRELKETVESVVRTLVGEIIELKSARHDEAFDDFVGDIVEANPGYADVFGKGKSSKISDKSTQAEARKVLRKQLQTIAKIEDRDDWELTKDALIQAVVKKFKPNNAAKNGKAVPNLTRISRAAPSGADKVNEDQEMLDKVARIMSRE